MALNRTVSTGFWTDTKVLDQFSPEDKYFYLYLITNPLTNMAGCYELSIREAEHKTGYTRDTILNLLSRMENYHNVIRYDSKTGEVLLLNWGKYNWGKSPKVKASAMKFAEQIKNEAFKKYVIDNLESRDFTAPTLYKKAEPEQKPTVRPIKEDWQSWPELGEVMDYAEAKGYKRYVGKSFYYYHDRNSWKDANGNPIKDWKKYFDACAQSGSIGSEVG